MPGSVPGVDVVEGIVGVVGRSTGVDVEDVQTAEDVVSTSRPTPTPPIPLPSKYTLIYRSDLAILRQVVSAEDCHITQILKIIQYWQKKYIYNFSTE